jgi:hypothetical protein
LIAMSVTEATIGAAALLLLFAVTGLPGHRGGTAEIGGEIAAVAPGSAPVLYSVWHEDTPLPRYVTPPLPGAELTTAEITYHALGSATVHAIGLPQVLSVNEVTIAPGGSLVMANPGGSGLIYLRTGWLELTERSGDARLVRSPLATSPAPLEDETPPTLAPGDRLSFGPESTIVLRNRGEHPAELLTASVLAVPGLAA